jgi:hypothetical protein
MAGMGLMDFVKAKPGDFNEQARLLQERADVHRRRAIQLDREGKHVKAMGERDRALRLDERARISRRRAASL